MPDRPLSQHANERTRSDHYVVIGIVLVCVLMALVLLGAGMIDTGGKSATQPSNPAPVTGQTP